MKGNHARTRSQWLKFIKQKGRWREGEEGRGERWEERNHRWHRECVLQQKGHNTSYVSVNNHLFIKGFKSPEKRIFVYQLPVSSGVLHLCGNSNTHAVLIHLRCTLSPSSARRLSCWSTWPRRGSTSARWSRRPLRRTTTSSSTPRKSLRRRWRPTRRTGRPCWPPCWRGCRRRYCPVYFIVSNLYRESVKGFSKGFKGVLKHKVSQIKIHNWQSTFNFWVHFVV